MDVIFNILCSFDYLRRVFYALLVILRKRDLLALSELIYIKVQFTDFARRGRGTKIRKRNFPSKGKSVFWSARCAICSRIAGCSFYVGTWSVGHVQEVLEQRSVLSAERQSRDISGATLLQDKACILCCSSSSIIRVQAVFSCCFLLPRTFGGIAE